jgi:Uncharacterized alpha/beta hydrolase domain (DUF2235)
VADSNPATLVASILPLGEALEIRIPRSHRRPFVPTFWTIERGREPKGHVEQTWFAGAHCNVGGGYQQNGLSDEALIWMIARVQALTNLEFNIAAVRQLRTSTLRRQLSILRMDG